MDKSKKTEIERIINIALNRAEQHWEDGGHQIQEAVLKANASMESYAADSSESNLPGYPTVSEQGTLIGEFVAFVADMRDSTQHLIQAISAKKATVSQLQRVFYETSALLPALAKTVEFEGGRVTEYLGDGVLAFFHVDEDNRSDAMYKARKAAKDTIEETRPILNRIISNRYGLPDIDIGVGLAMSKAIVSLVGLPNDRQPKAFGECVFRATKMSNGRNEIYVDERMQKIWPSSSTGKVRFTQKSFGEGDKRMTGYLMGYSSTK